MRRFNYRNSTALAFCILSKYKYSINLSEPIFIKRDVREVSSWCIAQNAWYTIYMVSLKVIKNYMHFGRLVCSQECSHRFEFCGKLPRGTVIKVFFKKFTL